MAELPLEITVEALSEQFAQAQGKPSNLRLIDCREEDEWHICRIDGAELVPLSRFVEEATAKLAGAAEQAIIVYCHHGMRSLRATHWLRQQGFRQTQSLMGGIDRWADLVEPEMRKY